MATSTFMRLPTKKLKICHLLSAQYNEETKQFHTAVGEVRRARIIATVIEKKYQPRVENPEMSQDNQQQGTSERIILVLDDGTGIIRATHWNATESMYKNINIGQDVEAFGLVKMYRDRPNITLDFVNLITDPNYELLRDLEIKKALVPYPGKKVTLAASNQVQDVLIPEMNPPQKTPAPVAALVNVKKTAKKQEDAQKKDDFAQRDKVYEIILGLDSGSGVSFEDILAESQIQPDELKRILALLEKETAIGETRPGFFQPL